MGCGQLWTVSHFWVWDVIWMTNTDPGTSTAMQSHAKCAHQRQGHWHGDTGSHYTCDQRKCQTYSQPSHVKWSSLNKLFDSFPHNFPLSLTSGQSCPCLHQVGEGGLQLRGDDEGDEAQQSEAQSQHQGHRGGGEWGAQRGEQAGRAGQQDAWWQGEGKFY